MTPSQAHIPTRQTPRRLFTLVLLPLILTALTTDTSAQTQGTIVNYAGTYSQAGGFSGDGGPATSALLDDPKSLVSDSHGNIFFADYGNYRVRRIDAVTGVLTTYAGNGTEDYTTTPPIVINEGDGGPANLASIFAYSIAMDSNDNLYIWQPGNIGITESIRMVSAQTGIINTVVSFPVSQNFESTGFAVNPSGTVFYLLSGPAVYQVSASTGAVSVFAGNAKESGYSGDGGPAISATLGTDLFSLATDTAGDLFINDITGYGYIREVDTSGIISTVLSHSCCPIDIAADSAGNFFASGSSFIGEVKKGTATLTSVVGDGKPISPIPPIVNGSYAVDVEIAAGAMAFDPSGNLFFADSNNIVAKVFSLGVSKPSNGTATIVSSATSLVQTLAPGSIATAYAPDLANATASSTTVPLPTSLSGTTATILDSAGVTTPASLFFVSPTQVNFYIPTNVANGAATVTFTSGDETQSVGNFTVATVAPGLFVLNSTGLAAANVITLDRDGTTVTGNDFQIVDDGIAALPINLGPPAQRVYLVLYGTGISGRTSIANVSFNIGGMSLPVAYAGPQGDEGLDQVNVEIPLSLAGIGITNISLTVDGITSNVATINIM